MLIVFEGADGAGKTTLLRAVAEELTEIRPFDHPVDVYRWVPKPGPIIAFPYSHTEHEKYNALTHFSFAKHDLLMDRAWPTDVVYSKVYHRDAYDRTYARPFRDFDGRFVIVYVTVSDPETLLRRLTGRGGRDADQMSFLPEIWAEYERYFGALPKEDARHVVRVVSADGKKIGNLADYVVSGILSLEKNL